MADQSEASEGFYEMLWDCPHCDTKGLLGKSQRHCANCGAPQDASKRYFPTPDQQKLVVGHTFVGADTNCPACNAPQSAAAKNCTQCGSPMDGSKEVAGFADVPPPVAAAAAVAAAPPPRRRVWPWLAGIGALAAILFGVWFMFIRTRIETVTITGHRWERTIAIDEFGEHAHEAWRNEVPASASYPSCYRKQRSTRQVPDGEECHTERHDKKDGTFEQVRKCSPKTRSVPVDDDWCSYTMREWAKVSEARANGADLSPAWPTVSVPSDAPAVIGSRRQGSKNEKLTIDFGPSDSCDVGDAIWRKYTDGQVAKLEVRARSGGVVCGSL